MPKRTSNWYWSPEELAQALALLPPPGILFRARDMERAALKVTGVAGRGPSLRNRLLLAGRVSIAQYAAKYGDGHLYGRPAAPPPRPAPAPFSPD